MADTKISALTASGALGGTERVPVSTAGVNYYITTTQIQTYVLASYAGASSITTVGTITTGTWTGSVISATYGGTGLSSLGTGVATFLGTPSSANLRTVVTDETGTGALVFATSPTLTTPNFSSIVNTGTLTLPTATDTLVARTTTDTLTNKRVTPRVSTNAAPASPLAWNSDSYDQITITGLSGALTINADSGTPTEGQKITFRLKDNGTARALTWTTGSTASFRAVGITLPTTTVISKTVYVGAIYNSTDSRWDVVSVAQEA